MVILPVWAQGDLSETYRTPDHSVTFRYPQGWDIETDSDHVITLTREGASITLLPPAALDALGVDEITGTAGMIQLVGAAYELQDTTPVNIGENAGEQRHLIGADGTSLDVFTWSLADSGDLVVMVLGPLPADTPSSADEDTALAVAGSLQISAPAIQLEHYAGDWQDAVAELEQDGIIAAGGSLIFLEDKAFFSGQGDWFTALAGDKPRTDIIMAGELTFREGSTTELETCSLVSRITETDSIEQSGVPIPKTLDVGIDNDNDIFYFDFDGDDSYTDYVSPENFDPIMPHHFMILARDNLLTVFVDGKAIFKDIRIAERAGTYGIALRGRGPDALCEGRNIWAYEAPLLRPGVCEITAASPVNERSGPGTSYSTPGLLPGTTAHAHGKITASDGFLWWNLDDDTWVRSDVVTAQGDCDIVAETNP